jgi:hypothetical protein
MGNAGPGPARLQCASALLTVDWPKTTPPSASAIVSFLGPRMIDCSNASAGLQTIQYLDSLVPDTEAKADVGNWA